MPSNPKLQPRRLVKESWAEVDEPPLLPIQREVEIADTFDHRFIRSQPRSVRQTPQRDDRATQRRQYYRSWEVNVKRKRKTQKQGPLARRIADSKTSHIPFAPSMGSTRIHVLHSLMERLAELQTRQRKKAKRSNRYKLGIRQVLHSLRRYDLQTTIPLAYRISTLIIARDLPVEYSPERQQVETACSTHGIPLCAEFTAHDLAQSFSGITKVNHVNFIVIFDISGAETQYQRLQRALQNKFYCGRRRIFIPSTTTSTQSTASKMMEQSPDDGEQRQQFVETDLDIKFGS